MLCRVLHQFCDAINSRTGTLDLDGAHVEHWYARLCRAPDLEILFLSEFIMKRKDLFSCT